MKIIVRANTKKEESDRVYDCLKRITHFDENKYNPSFPVHEIIEGLKEKGRKKELNELDYKIIENIIEKVYNAKNYEHDVAIIEDYRELAEIALLKREKVFERYKEAWGFKTFDEYLVNITSYGPGGSYNWKTGRIFMQAKNKYKNLSNSILHEIVHIGIEEALIKKYNINHPTKEYIVDRFMINHFDEEFLNCIEQNSSEQVNPEIKMIFEEPTDWLNINVKLENIFADKPKRK